VNVKSTGEVGKFGSVTERCAMVVTVSSLIIVPYVVRLGINIHQKVRTASRYERGWWKMTIKEKKRDTKEWKPTQEQAIHLREFSINGEHFVKNINTIREQYAGQFIAIYDKDVVLSASTPEELLKEIRSKFAETELPKVYTVYVPKENEVRIPLKGTRWI